MGVQDFRKERIRDIVKRELEFMKKTDELKEKKIHRIHYDIDAEKQNRYLYSLCKITTLYGELRAQIMDMNIPSQDKDDKIKELDQLKQLGAKLTERLESAIQGHQQAETEYQDFVNCGKRLFKGDSSVNIKDIYNKAVLEWEKAREELDKHFKAVEKPTNQRTQEDIGHILEPDKLCDVMNRYANANSLLNHVVGPSSQEINLHLGARYDTKKQEMETKAKNLGISSTVTQAGMLTTVTKKYEKNTYTFQTRCLTNAAKNQQVIEMVDKKGVSVSGIAKKKDGMLQSKLEFSAKMQETKIAYNPNASKFEQSVQQIAFAGKALSKYTEPAEKASLKIAEALLNPTMVADTAISISEDLLKQVGKNITVSFEVSGKDSAKVSMNLGDFYDIAKGDLTDIENVKDGISELSDHTKIKSHRNKIYEKAKDVFDKTKKFFKDITGSPISYLSKHVLESMNTCRNLDKLNELDKEINFEKRLHEKICDVQEKDFHGQVTLIDRTNLELVTASARSNKQYVEKITKDDVEVQDIGSR